MNQTMNLQLENLEMGRVYDIQIYYPAHTANAEIPNDKDRPEQYIDHLKLKLVNDSELSYGFDCLHPDANCQSIIIAKNLISQVRLHT